MEATLCKFADEPDGKYIVNDHCERLFPFSMRVEYSEDDSAQVIFRKTQILLPCYQGQFQESDFAFFADAKGDWLFVRMDAGLLPHLTFPLSAINFGVVSMLCIAALPERITTLEARLRAASSGESGRMNHA